MTEQPKNGHLSSTSDYAGKFVEVERERTIVETFQARCVEINDSGFLVQYKERRKIVTKFIPWSPRVTIRHTESEMVRPADGHA